MTLSQTCKSAEGVGEGGNRGVVGHGGLRSEHIRIRNGRKEELAWEEEGWGRQGLRKRETKGREVQGGRVWRTSNAPDK